MYLVVVVGFVPSFSSSQALTSGLMVPNHRSARIKQRLHWSIFNWNDGNWTGLIIPKWPYFRLVNFDSARYLNVGQIWTWPFWSIPVLNILLLCMLQGQPWFWTFAKDLDWSFDERIELMNVELRLTRLAIWATSDMKRDFWPETLLASTHFSGRWSISFFSSAARARRGVRSGGLVWWVMRCFLQGVFHDDKKGGAAMGDDVMT